MWKETSYTDTNFVVLTVGTFSLKWCFLLKLVENGEDYLSVIFVLLGKNANESVLWVVNKIDLKLRLSDVSLFQNSLIILSLELDAHLSIQNISQGDAPF